MVNVFDKITDLTLLDNESNKVSLIGEFLGIEEEGLYNGKRSMVVLFKTNRDKNKPLYVWIGFEDNKTNTNFILDNLNKKVYIEGYLTVVPVFNDKAISHTFIVPEIIDILSDEEVNGINNVNVSDFVTSYTVNNRVVLEGKIVGEVWKEFIEPVNNHVTRFQIEIDVNNKKRRIYCTVWDTVKDNEEVKTGIEVRIVGSYTMLKKERGLYYKNGYIIESRKNKLDSYVVIVQKINLLNK